MQSDTQLTELRFLIKKLCLSNQRDLDLFGLKQGVKGKSETIFSSKFVGIWKETNNTSEEIPNIQLLKDTLKVINIRLKVV